ncbi:MAG TPA: hypothetical protein RMG45_33320, partial [Polyangiaceae bacterium LLY-WYZ-15_(1-7)]|nr:hypothetical protein [Polyangiaceae bacterium LLY-WYZ-15_(1-7)]
MRSFALALALLAFPALASADAIRAPRECPEPGWIAKRVGHGGWCFPRDCESDADCLGGGRCEEVARCWRQSTYSMGRRRFEDRDRPRPTRARPGDRCAADGSCSGEAECRTANECVYGEGVSREPVWDHGSRRPAGPPPGTEEPPGMTEAPAMTEA